MAFFAIFGRKSGWIPLPVREELPGQLKTPSGQILQEVRAEFDGIVLYHMNSLWVEQGESLIACGKF